MSNSPKPNLRVFIFDQKRIVDRLKKAFAKYTTDYILKIVAVSDGNYEKAEKLLKENIFDIVILNGGEFKNNNPRNQPLTQVKIKGNSPLRYIYTGLINYNEKLKVATYNVLGYYDKNEITPTQLVQKIMKNLNLVKKV